jgi:hypothetical protein
MSDSTVHRTKVYQAAYKRLLRARRAISKAQARLIAAHADLEHIRRGAAAPAPLPVLPVPQG